MTKRKQKIGKLIVLYGVNNLGKSTQAKLLVDYLENKKTNAHYVKYPIYENRSGKLINDYLRKGVKVSPQDYHILQVINKFEFANELDNILHSGIWVVAEDYILTGIAWAIANGLDQKKMEMFYTPLRVPDKAVVLDGERFKDAIEKNHKHETDNDITARCRSAHLKLAKQYQYPIINANQTIAKVFSDLKRELKII